MQDLKEPLGVHIVPVGCIGREVIDVLNEQLLVDAVHLKALIAQGLFDLIPRIIVREIHPSGAKGTLITLVVRAPRADDDSDFIAVHISHDGHPLRWRVFR